MKLTEATNGTRVRSTVTKRVGTIINAAGIEHRQIEWDDGDRSVIQVGRLDKIEDSS